MPKYIIAQLDISDRERYGQYEAGFLDIFARHDGKLLAVDENQKVIEGGTPPTRTVLIEFPDEASAMAWYESDDYQALMQHRLAASSGDIIMIEALPPMP